MRLERIAPIACLFLAASRTAVPQTTHISHLTQSHVQDGVVTDMQMLRASSGWARVGGSLLWTEDNGQTWQEITPPQLSGGALIAMFFLNASTAWVVGEHIDAQKNVQLTVLSTADGGKNWSNQPFSPNSEPESKYSEFLQGRFAHRGYLTFSDTQHGWLELQIVTSASFSSAYLFSTSDGGSTWSQLPFPPICDRMKFISPTVGWLGAGRIGSLGSDRLYFTDDGGQHWQQQEVTAPAEAAGFDRALYDLPSFPAGSAQGLLPVTFFKAAKLPRTSTSWKDSSVFAVYASSDGGRNWTPLTVDPNIPVDGRVPAAAYDSTVIKTFVSNGRFITGTHASNKAVGLPPTMPKKAGVTKISFVDALHGWLLVSGSTCEQPKTNCTSVTALLTTVDGGQTVAEITPKMKATSISGPRSEAVTIERNVAGFDTCVTLTPSQMSTWWDTSPYSVVGVYIGGDNEGCKSWNNSMVNFAWEQNAGCAGWEFAPIYVGPQPSCLNPGNCPGGCSQISTDLNAAYNQGVDSAGDAIRIAYNSLLFDEGFIVYYDLESYDSNNSSSVAATTQSFLQGWADMMHVNGQLAGAYGSTSNATQWVIPGAFAPDEVYLADVQSPINTSVYGLDYVPDGWWVYDQRIHQYNINVFESHGGVGTTIDQTTVDAEVTEMDTEFQPACCDDVCDSSCWNYNPTDPSCQNDDQSCTDCIEEYECYPGDGFAPGNPGYDCCCYICGDC